MRLGFNMLDQDWSLNLDRTGPIWSWFDPNRYARCDTLAAHAARKSFAAAFNDHQERGAALGYPPNLFFDPVYYLAANPNVNTSIRAGEFRSAFDHYCRVGWRDRDPHWLFSTTLYSSNHADLTPDAIDAFGGLYGHFLCSGAGEGRCAHHFFNASWYVAHLPLALVTAAVKNPFGHFLAALDASAVTGSPEPQGSPYFDPAWYLATYLDVAKDIAAGRLQGALYHYLKSGAAEGRDPLCDFSEADYRQTNPDVEISIRNGQFRSGYDHFLNFGALSFRSPCRGIDLHWYTSQPTVARDLASGRFAHAFDHLLAVGIPDGLPLYPPSSSDFAPNEAESRATFLAQARRALPGLGRRPLDFSYDGAPDVSVIVILRNQFALTMQALASLRHTYSGSTQLILVDNASHDETRCIADLVHGAQIIRLEENVGFLRACNLALTHTAASAVLYLNNDIVLHSNAVCIALNRLSADLSIGAVGGKIVRTHGLLQEAGCILWRDGSADGWMRDAPPDVPEANYVRDVDYCSGAFLMVRGDLLRTLGGFDDAYAPAYYEEVDLCLRIQAAGFRVLYDPAIVLTHFEYGSSRSLRAASALMRANRSVLSAQHSAALRGRLVDRRHTATAANFASRGRRVLFLEDTVPLHRMGSGYGRAADALNALVIAGWQATVFPMHPVRTPLHQITATLPETVEILWDRDHRSLASFLAERRGHYDLIWISRAHNFRQLFEVISHSGVGLESAHLVLDTEAVFSLRNAAQAELDDLPFNLPRALAHEFEGAWLCDHVVAVNQAEAAVLRTLSLPSVGVVGFRQVSCPTPAPWNKRRGLLHVGALTASTSPNCDGLRWYIDAVQPALEALIGCEAATLTVAGHLTDDLDLSWLRDHPAINFLGPVTDLTPLYASHRVFVAPTRFAAGVPTKVLDAAAHGLPVACTELLVRQLSWQDGCQIASAPASDPVAFATAIARLYTDEGAWKRIRSGALDKLAVENSPSCFATQIDEAVSAAGACIAAVSRPSAHREVQNAYVEPLSEAAPVRSTNRTPVSNAQSGTGSLPRGRGRLGGNRATTKAQISSGLND